MRSLLVRFGLIREDPTEEGFKEWLDSKDDTEVVGDTMEPSSCPLANYLLSLGYNDPQVYLGQATYDGVFNRRRIRRGWMDNAILVADTGGPRHRESFHVVTASEMKSGMGW